MRVEACYFLSALREEAEEEEEANEEGGATCED
jgi:hypothetical protein